MVVLSAAVLSKQAPLLARQFVEITKIRMEGLLSAFLKLVEAGGRDHTYIETESVRYVYQPMESLYLLLITNKTSNILEDLDTIRLLQQCVQDCCHLTPILAEHVSDKAFDIIFSFDELISFGYRESVTLSQIRTYTGMESHEEKLQDMIRKSKEQEEADRRKQIASKLDKEHALKKREERERNRAAVAAEFDNLTSVPRTLEPSSQTVTVPAVSTDMFSSVGGPTGSSAGVGSGAPKRGMQLGKKAAAGTELLESLGGPQRGDVAGDVSSGASPATTAAPGAVANPLLDPVELIVEEKVSAALVSEGGVTDMDCQGNLLVTVVDAAKAGLANFKLSCSDGRFRVNTHPTLNKAAFANGVLELSDTGKPFRQGVSAPLLKWRSLPKSSLATDGAFPLNVSCWPSDTGDGMSMTVELELVDLDVTLNDLRLSFPLPKSGTVDVVSVQAGNTSTSNGGNVLNWDIPTIDRSTCQASSMEFVATGDKSSSIFFPVKLAASMQSSILKVEVTECYHQQRQEPLQYSMRRVCTLEGTISA